MSGILHPWLPSRVYADLLGKPFRYNGRGPEFYDCAGLVLEIQQRLGHELLVPGTPSGKGEQASAMVEILQAAWREIPAPEPGCIVFFPGIAHVGTMISSLRFFHTDSDLGAACIESLADPLWQRKRFSFHVPAGPGL